MKGREMAAAEAKRQREERRAFRARVVALARQGLPCSVISERLGTEIAGVNQLGNIIRAAGEKVTPERDWLP